MHKIKCHSPAQAMPAQAWEPEPEGVKSDPTEGLRMEVLPATPLLLPLLLRVLVPMVAEQPVHVHVSIRTRSRTQVGDSSDMGHTRQTTSCTTQRKRGVNERTEVNNEKQYKRKRRQM